MKVLWCGDGGVSTGFARVNESIINNLPEDKYEIHHLAVNYWGDPYESKAKMYPAQLGGDVLGFNRIKSLYDSIKPDLVFILGDVWVIPGYLDNLPEDAKVITYFPVDSAPLSKAWVDKIAERAVPVSYTEYGKKVFQEASPKTDVRIIPHGIDTKTFYPIDIIEARSKIEGIKPYEFVVLNAN